MPLGQEKTIMPVAGPAPVAVTDAPPASAGLRVWTAAESAQYSACTAEYRRLTGGTSRPTAAVQYMSYAGWLSRNRAACYKTYQQIRLRKLFANEALMRAHWARVNPEAVAARIAKAKAIAAAIAAAKKKRYLELCNKIQMPPLGDLGYDTLTIIRTTIGRDVDEPASEKREMRAILYARLKVIKLHALGLGPLPPGGMPTSGPTLYWVPELAFKREVCGSLTAAETARAIELGNAARAFLHKRARDKRKSRLKRLVAVAAIVVGAVYLGPMISGALKGTAAAGGVTGGGTAAATSSAAAAKVAAAKVIAAKTAAAAASKAAIVAKVAAAGKAIGGAKMLATATAKSAAKSAAVKQITSTVATKSASKLALDAATAAANVSPSGIAETAASLATRAKELVPKVVDVANNARTLKAIADGEIPPPPITLSGDSFREYATSLAQQYLEKEIRDKRERLTEAQLAADNREIQIEIDRLQRETVERLRRQKISPDDISAPLRDVDAAVAAGERAAPDDMMKYAVLAVPLAAMLFMR